MIPLTTFAGRTLAVFGLARTGLTTAEALEAGGAHALCWDDNEPAREQAAAAGLTLCDLARVDWRHKGIEALVLAPGVPLTHPEPHWVVAAARAAGVPIIGDTELFLAEHRALGSGARVVGITGTNGKSTTTALTAHLFATAGLETSIGGNIGQAVLGLAPFHDSRIYVLELSSYQIDLTPNLTLSAAALLNISPDHLDRHGSMANYARIKGRIFSSLAPGARAVVGVDDAHARAIAERLAPSLDIRRVSVEGPVADGIYAARGVLYNIREGREIAALSLAGIETLRGRHNWQNAAVAWALAEGLGLSPDVVARGLKSFPGLAHRLEIVGRRGHVLFVNDSKASNADAARHALAAFDNIHWILGGLAKEGGIDELAPYFGKVRRAYLIGEAAQAFATRLAGGGVDFVLCGELERALELAAHDAAEAGKEGGGERVVLLSPACASFDQFASFEERGDAFKAAVARLEGIALGPSGGSHSA